MRLFGWFRKREESPLVLTKEERISKAKALERAGNYVEAAIVLLKDAEKIKSRLSTRDIHKIQNQVLGHLNNARELVVTVNEQLISRMLDDTTHAISYSRNPKAFIFMGGKDFNLPLPVMKEF